MLTLYYAPGSSSMASHLVLEEAGAEYETRFVNEDAGEHRTEAYLRVNPRGKVPALRLADGSVLVENVASSATSPAPTRRRGCCPATPRARRAPCR
jgi:glutathione S-transferase